VTRVKACGQTTGQRLVDEISKDIVAGARSWSSLMSSWKNIASACDLQKMIRWVLVVDLA
jgi:hypothetical protein